MGVQGTVPSTVRGAGGSVREIVMGESQRRTRGWGTCGGVRGKRRTESLHPRRVSV